MGEDDIYVGRANHLTVLSDSLKFFYIQVL